MIKAGRNDPCPCGSGKKYKKCCADKKGLHPDRVTVVSSQATKKEGSLGKIFQNHVLNHSSLSPSEKKEKPPK